MSLEWGVLRLFPSEKTDIHLNSENRKIIDFIGFFGWHASWLRVPGCAEDKSIEPG
jgi:hypothetical protein